MLNILSLSAFDSELLEKMPLDIYKYLEFMTPRSNHSSNLSLNALEAMRLLVLIARPKWMVVPPIFTSDIPEGPSNRNLGFFWVFTVIKQCLWYVVIYYFHWMRSIWAFTAWKKYVDWFSIIYHHILDNLWPRYVPHRKRPF